MKTVAWDVDDTLNRLMQVWFEDWCNQGTNKQLIEYDQLIENPPFRILGISEDEYQASLDIFRLSEAYKKLMPVSEIKSWFVENGDRARHIALTAVPILAAPYSAAWVLKHFSRWIRSFNVVPSPRKSDPVPIYDQTKIAFILWVGKVDILVDDNPSVLQDAREVGIETVMIPQPWNESKLDLTQALQRLTQLIHKE